MYILYIYIIYGGVIMITLQKWGNSQGIRLPKFLLNELGWSENEELAVVKEDDKLIIKKHNKRKNIIELFDGYNGEYKPEEIDWGEAKGKEIW